MLPMVAVHQKGPSRCGLWTEVLALRVPIGTQPVDNLSNLSENILNVLNLSYNKSDFAVETHSKEDAHLRHSARQFVNAV